MRSLQPQGRARRRRRMQQEAKEKLASQLKRPRSRRPPAMQSQLRPRERTSRCRASTLGCPVTSCLDSIPYLAALWQVTILEAWHVQVACAYTDRYCMKRIQFSNMLHATITLQSERGAPYNHKRRR